MRVADFAGFVAILAALSLESCVLAHDNDRSTLFEMASHGYRIGRDLVAPLEDEDALLRIARDDDSTSERLAQLILARNLVLKSKQSLDQRFLNEVLELQGAIGEAILDSAARQSVSEFLGQDSSGLGELQSIAREFRDIGSQVIGSQTQNYATARKGWLLEGLICDEANQMLSRESECSTQLAEKAFRVRTTSRRSGSRPFAAFTVTSRTETPLSWAVIVLKLDCKYQIPASSKASTALGQNLGRMFFGDAVPNYVRRDRSREEYSNLDKSAMFFVQDWQPGRIVQLISLPADEYFSTVKDATIEVITSDGLWTFKAPVERHKTNLRSKYAPKRSNRRR